MQITDPVADMLNRIRNANSAKHDTVDVPASNLKKAIAQILLEEGYIKAYSVVDNGNQGQPLRLKRRLHTQRRLGDGQVPEHSDRQRRKLCDRGLL